LTTEEIAAQWFSILPPASGLATPAGYRYDRRTRAVTLGRSV
jgi:hypothetical protein